MPVDYKKYTLFFTLHFFYYNFFGPFIAIFFLFTRRSRMLMYNMHIVRKSWYCFTNTLPWIATALVFSYSFLTGFKNDIYAVIIYNTVTISILKCAIIAGKYASLSHEKLEQYKMRIISDTELSEEHMLESWALQNSA